MEDLPQGADSKLGQEEPDYHEKTQQVEETERVDQEFKELDAKVAKLKTLLDEERPPEQQRFYRGVLLVTYLGVFFVIALLIPTAIGWYCDSLFKSKPLWTIIGMLLGLAAGASGCYKILKSYWERL